MNINNNTKGKDKIMAKNALVIFDGANTTIIFQKK